MEGNNIRQKVIHTAEKYLGYNEEDNSHREIIDIYNAHKPLARNYYVQYDDFWCATFVSAISILLECTDIMPTECSCGEMIKLYKQLGSWQEDDSYVPMIGDIIFYDWDPCVNQDCTGYPEHVGIVVEISKSIIKAIEGNKKKKVDYREMEINWKYIRGYGLPKYEEKEAKYLENVRKDEVNIYTVKPGECLSEIAQRFKIKCKELANYNGISDPDKINAGQVIIIPKNHVEMMHLVQKGETLSEIAERYNTTVKKLVEANSIKNENHILVGQKLRIPL